MFLRAPPGWQRQARWHGWILEGLVVLGVPGEAFRVLRRGLGGGGILAEVFQVLRRGVEVAHESNLVLLQGLVVAGSRKKHELNGTVPPGAS